VRVPPHEPTLLSDPAALKALANPVRQRILQQLALCGPATSTTLARDLGITSGGTSYNLRVLAEHGFVEEVPERARGRERWWRRASRDVRLPLHFAPDDPSQATVEEIARLWFAADVELLERYLAERADLPNWAHLPPYSRGDIQVDPAEYATFFEEYLALLRRYQHPAGQASPETRTVLVRLLAHPVPGLVPRAEEPRQ